MNHAMHFHLAPRDMGDLRFAQYEALEATLRQMEAEQRKSRA